jgi:hypothetical protein
MEDLYEYSVVCPSCKAKVKILSKESPLVFRCGLCTCSVMVCDEGVFPIRSGFLENIFRKYRAKVCGEVVLYREPPKKLEFITEDRVEDFKNKTDDTIFTEDILKYL